MVPLVLLRLLESVLSLYVVMAKRAGIGDCYFADGGIRVVSPFFRLTVTPFSSI